MPMITSNAMTAIHYSTQRIVKGDPIAMTEPTPPELLALQKERREQARDNSRKLMRQAGLYRNWQEGRHAPVLNLTGPQPELHGIMNIRRLERKNPQCLADLPGAAVEAMVYIIDAMPEFQQPSLKPAPIIAPRLLRCITLNTAGWTACWRKRIDIPLEIHPELGQALKAAKTATDLLENKGLLVAPVLVHPASFGIL